MFAILRSSAWICLLIFVTAGESSTGLLRNIRYNKCLRPAFNGKGAWITLDDCSHTASGLLTIDMSEILENSPTYTGSMRFMSNWLCLTLSGNSLDNGQPFLTSDCLGETHQNWKPVIEEPLSGTFHFMLIHSGRCLSVENNGATITQSDCVGTEGGSHQAWKFEPFNEPHPYKLLETVGYQDQCLQCMPSGSNICGKISVQSCDTNPETNLLQRVACKQPRGGTTQISIAGDDICLAAAGFPVDGSNKIVAPGYCQHHARQDWKLVYLRENSFQLLIEEACLESFSSLKMLGCSFSSGKLWKFRSFNPVDTEVFSLENRSFTGKCIRPNPNLFQDYEVVTCDATQGDQAMNAKNFLAFEFSFIVFKGICLGTSGRFTAATKQQARGLQDWCDLLTNGNCPTKFFDENLARVVRGTCSDQTNQKWRIFNGRLGGLFQLQNEENGECLTIKQSLLQTSLWVDECSKLTSDQFWSVRTAFV